MVNRGRRIEIVADGGVTVDLPPVRGRGDPLADAARRLVGTVAALYQCRYTFVSEANRDLVASSPDVRRVAGRELERVQRGADPTDWKPIASIGRGAREIGVHVGGELRVVCVATFPEAIYVLHVFEKKTRKTSSRDLTLGQQRHHSMMQGRRTS